MICAWKELLAILPPWLREDVDNLARNTLLEIRLRVNSPPELVLTTERKWLERIVTEDDLNFCVNAASRYSPWTATTASKGYITAPGGHRIGLCGNTVYHGDQNFGIRDLQSICIRIAKEIPGAAVGLQNIVGSTLILGAPGWGKTTLLRDFCKQMAKQSSVSVVDERAELFPVGFARENRLDVLSGCPKAEGIEMLLRTMTPDYIAVDEITAQEDCKAIISASNCGVSLLATAHAASMQEFRSRDVYRPLVERRIFKNFVILRKDKSYTQERMFL